MNSLDYWNLRASTFGEMNAKYKAQGGYMPRLIKLLALESGQTVFDMGCATGTLARPLARAGHSVMARDFSPRMIERLEHLMADEGISNIDTALMAWEDDWEACGIRENSVDVAVASRSLPCRDGELERALRNLDRVARVKAAVTVSATSAPALDERLCAHLAREVPVPKSHVLVIDALAEMGRLPEMTYIPFERPMRFVDKDMAWLELRKLAGEPELDTREQELFEDYASEHFSMQESDGGVVYQLDYRLDVAWAFICWPTGGAL